MLYWYLKGVMCPDAEVRQYCLQLYFDLTTTGGSIKDFSQSTQATYDYYHNKIKELSRKTPDVPITIDYEIVVDEDVINMIHSVEYLNGKGTKNGIRPKEVMGEPINETPY